MRFPIFLSIAIVLSLGSANSQEGVLVHMTTMSDVLPLNADGLNADGTAWHATSYQSIVEIEVDNKRITVTVVHPSQNTPGPLGIENRRFQAIIPADDYRRITSGTDNAWIRAEVIKIQDATE